MKNSIFSLKSQLADITNVEFNIFDISLDNIITPNGFCSRCKTNAMPKQFIKMQFARRRVGAALMYITARNH